MTAKAHMLGIQHGLLPSRPLPARNHDKAGHASPQTDTSTNINNISNTIRDRESVNGFATPEPSGLHHWWVCDLSQISPSTFAYLKPFNEPKNNRRKMM